jgi:Cu/Ag efflux protein CusF
MRTHRITAVLVAALAVSAPVVPALAGPAAAASHARALRPGHGTTPAVVVLNGRITSVDPATRALTVLAHGRAVPLTLPATATVRRDGAAATIADLAVGDRVSVRSGRVGRKAATVQVVARSAEEPEDRS